LAGELTDPSNDKHLNFTMVVSELTASAVAMKSSPPSDRGDSSSSIEAQLLPLQNCAKQGKSPFIKAYEDSLVAWQLLDNESVERARRENKLIFLHIGYRACHCEFVPAARWISLTWSQSLASWP
jgi:hypothetical protein